MSFYSRLRARYLFAQLQTRGLFQSTAPRRFTMCSKTGFALTPSLALPTQFGMATALSPYRPANCSATVRRTRACLPVEQPCAPILSHAQSHSFSTRIGSGQGDEEEEDEEEKRVKLREIDIEEQFVRGSGPGGQKINKSSVCVVLKHIPTGIIVRCQESRSQVKNREIARKILRKKLEEILLGEESEAAREASRARARKAKRRRKSVKKHFKSRRDRLLLD